MKIETVKNILICALLPLFVRTWSIWEVKPSYTALFIIFLAFAYFSKVGEGNAEND